jgi:hypothetical protein
LIRFCLHGLYEAACLPDLFQIVSASQKKRPKTTFYFEPNILRMLAVLRDFGLR